MFTEMSPRPNRLLGQQLESAGTLVWLKGGETLLTLPLTADVPSNFQLSLHLLLLELLKIHKTVAASKGDEV